MLQIFNWWNCWHAIFRQLYKVYKYSPSAAPSLVNFMHLKYWNNKVFSVTVEEFKIKFKWISSGQLPEFCSVSHCSQFVNAIGLQRDVVYFGWPIAPSYSIWAQIRGGGGGLQGLNQWGQLYTGAQINFGDLTPNLTSGGCYWAAAVLRWNATLPHNKKIE